MDIIARPLGAIMNLIYSVLPNYGGAIIVFTVIVRVLLLPLTVKQQKSMAEMQKIQPLLAQIQSKYKNDKEKLNAETMKVYQEQGVNPAASCLPLIIQLPILFGLYQVISRPLTYLLNLSADAVNTIKEIVGYTVTGAFVSEIQIAQMMNNAIDAVKAQVPNVMPVDFNFLGMNLANTPKFYPNPSNVIMEPNNLMLLLIPLFAGLTTYLSSKLMSSGQANQSEQAASTQKTMGMIFPFMSAYFCLTLPAGMGIYWIAGNLLQILQHYTLDKHIKAKIAGEAIAAEPKNKKAKKAIDKPKKDGEVE